MSSSKRWQRSPARGGGEASDARCSLIWMLIAEYKRDHDNKRFASRISGPAVGNAGRRFLVSGSRLDAEVARRSGQHTTGDASRCRCCAAGSHLGPLLMSPERRRLPL